MASSKPFRILFVCTGNICRSPTADAVLRHMVMEAGLERVIEVDSAGTHGYHIGDPPDPRAIATALGHGVDMQPLRARTVCAEDFEKFDWVIAMDGGHHGWLDRLGGAAGKGRVRRFTGFLGRPDDDVPDPYYGQLDGFERVFDLVEQGCREILVQIQARDARQGQ